MQSEVDRHRRVDAAVVLVLLGQLESSRQLSQRQEVRAVAVDLVGRREDEGRVGLVTSRGFEQVQRSVRVDGEVRERLRRRPVVRRLCGGVDDELERRRVLPKDPVDGVGVANVEVERAELSRICLLEAPRLRTGRGGLAEEIGPHVVVDSEHVVAGLDEVRDRPRADQAA